MKAMARYKKELRNIFKPNRYDKIKNQATSKESKEAKKSRNKKVVMFLLFTIPWCLLSYVMFRSICCI